MTIWICLQAWNFLYLDAALNGDTLKTALPKNTLYLASVDNLTLIM